MRKSDDTFVGFVIFVACLAMLLGILVPSPFEKDSKPAAQPEIDPATLVGQWIREQADGYGLKASHMHLISTDKNSLGYVTVVYSVSFNGRTPQRLKIVLERAPYRVYDATSSEIPTG